MSHGSSKQRIPNTCKYSLSPFVPTDGFCPEEFDLVLIVES